MQHCWREFVCFLPFPFALSSPLASNDLPGLDQSSQLKLRLQFLLSPLKAYQVFLAVLHEHLANLSYRQLFNGTAIDGRDCILSLYSGLFRWTAFLNFIDHYDLKIITFGLKIQSAHVRFEGFGKLSIRLEHHSLPRVIKDHREATKNVSTD